MTVKLAPATTLFPSGGIYNVDRVVVLRKSGLLSTEVLATQSAASGQTDFTLAFDAPGLLNANELFAFVVTRLLPLDPPKLAIGLAKTSGAGLIGQITVTTHVQSETASGDITITDEVIAVSASVEVGQTETFTVREISGTYNENLEHRFKEIGGLLGCVQNVSVNANVDGGDFSGSFLRVSFSGTLIRTGGLSLMN